MGVIKVTQIERNGKLIASEDMLIEVGVIGTPLLENSSNKTIIDVEESIVSSRPFENTKPAQYIVDEDLAAVAALSDEIFIATVVTRRGRGPVAGASSLGFVTRRVIGGIRAEGSGSKFFYYENGDVEPVEYIVAETPAAIEISL